MTSSSGKKHPHTKASILEMCTQTDSRSHMGTSKMLTRQLEVMLISCGNPDLGPKQPAAHAGRPVWTVCWKHCYQHTSRNVCEGRTACVCVCLCVCWKADGGLQLSLSGRGSDWSLSGPEALFHSVPTSVKLRL